MNIIGSGSGSCGLYKSMPNQDDTNLHLHLHCRIQDVLKAHFTDLEQDQVLKEIWCAWIEKCAINTSRLLTDAIAAAKIVKLWDAFIETLTVKETLDLLTEYAYCEQSCEMMCERIRVAVAALDLA